MVRAMLATLRLLAVDLLVQGNNMESQFAQSFMKSILGDDGHTAFEKMSKRAPALATLLAPRTVLSWLATASRINYEGEVPGVHNSYIALSKSEGGFSGAIVVGSSRHVFEATDILHVAATLSYALGIQDIELDPTLRSTDISKLGKSIDLLVKAKTLTHVAGEEMAKFALAPTKMTQHGAFHIVHTPGQQYPYSIHSTATGEPVQTGIATLQHAQVIAKWHANKPVAKTELPGLAAPNRAPEEPEGPQAPVAKQPLMQKSRPTDEQLIAWGLDPKNYAGIKKDPIEMDWRTPASWPKEIDYKDLHPDLQEHVFHQGGEGIRFRVEPIDIHAPNPTLKGKSLLQYAQDMEWDDRGPEHVQSIAEGMKSGGTFGPAILDHNNGFLDGRHRILAAHSQGLKHIPAIRTPAPKVTKSARRELMVKKSEAEKACKTCGQKLFKAAEFTGCICFRALAKSVSTQEAASGYVLRLNRSQWDDETLQALISTFRG